LIYISQSGVICAFGSGLDALMSGTAGTSRALSRHEARGREFLVGKVPEAQICAIPDVLAPHNTRTNALLLTAALQIDALIASAIAKFGAHRVGVVFGTTTTGVEENFAAFAHYARADAFDGALYSPARNMMCAPSDFLALYYGLKGPRLAVSTACTSGIKALITGAMLISRGICDAVIAGGSDGLSTLTLFGFDSLSVLSQRPNAPFSEARDGINIGEAASVCVLSREAISNTVIAGFATNNDAHHTTQPLLSGEFGRVALQKCLKMADINEPDYINLHGTGTRANDEMESNLFGKDFAHVPASSVKPFIGHTLGCAGAIESAICVALCEQDGASALPVHILSGNYDPNLKALNLVRAGTRKVVKSAINASFAFGGDNAIIAFKRVS